MRFSKYFKYILIISILTFISSKLYSQTVLSGEDLLDSAKLLNARVVGAYIDGDDTLLNIVVHEVIVMPPRVFKNEKEKQRYTKLMYNVRKVYPYAQLIDIEYDEIEQAISEMEDEKEIKKYLKQREKELMTEFEDELRGLTFSQGRILIKLVDRQTGNTTYEVVKEFKGTLSAMFWQSIAIMFSSNLKYEYDEKEEDKWIEEIIILIENGQI